jgi:hypothetical protein
VAVPIPFFAEAEAATPILIHAERDICEARAMEDTGAGDAAEIHDEEIGRSHGLEANEAISILILVTRSNLGCSWSIEVVGCCIKAVGEAGQN